jgi:hypothetical protein
MTNSQKNVTCHEDVQNYFNSKHTFNLAYQLKIAARLHLSSVVSTLGCITWQPNMMSAVLLVFLGLFTLCVTAHPVFWIALGGNCTAVPTTHLGPHKAPIKDT